MMRELIRKILNEETNQGKYISALEDLTEDFKNEDCVCDIKIEHKPEEFRDIYLINVKVGNRDLDNKFNGIDYRIRNYLNQLRRKITEEVYDYLPIAFFVTFSDTPNCSDYKKLNESEDNEEKTIQKNLIVINKLISMFDYSEVCDMWVEYNPEDGDYEIKSKMSTKNHNTSALEKEFEFLENSIKYLGFTNCYVFRPYYVDQCEDEIKYMNESEDKKSSFLSLVEEHGLYEFMKMTGLSMKQITSKTGELPREVLEIYIKDFIENEGQYIPPSDGDVGLVFSIELSRYKEANSFYLRKGKVTVEVIEYDSNYRKVAGSYERLENLSDKEIFIILDGMSNWGETEYY